MLSLGRIFGALIGIAPFGVVLFCSLSIWRIGDGKAIILGYTLFLLGGFFSIVNFYLQVLRYPIHCMRHGEDAKYQWISGIPLLGILSVIGLAFLPKSLWLNVITFLLLCGDLGGIQWFVIFTWKDDSLWNPKKYNKEKSNI